MRFFSVRSSQKPATQLRPRTKRKQESKPRKRRPLQLEILEDRTLLSPVLTVTNLTINGSNGAIVSNGGTWFDDPGATLSLTASAGNVTRNTDGTWS